MEEIKFRGKRIDNGEWVYGNLIYSSDAEVDEDFTTLIIPQKDSNCFTGSSNDLGFECWYKVIPKTVGQYTGVDEIYSGDILTADYYPFKDDDKSNYNAEVYWDNGVLQFCICLHCVNPNKRGISDGMCEALTEREIKFTKIGNIYDNPELLER